jgi:hypothetical protein
VNFKNMGVDQPKGKPGEGSPTAYRFDLLPPLALAAVAEVLKLGADNYGEWTWTQAPPQHHLNKALVHCYAFLAGDVTEKDGEVIEHLRHAACRLLFTLEMLEAECDYTGANDADRACKEPVESLESVTERVKHAGVDMKGVDLVNEQINNLLDKVSKLQQIRDRLAGSHL